MELSDTEFVKIAHFKGCWRDNSENLMDHYEPLKLYDIIETQVKFEFGRNRIMGNGLSAPEFVKITHFRGC